MSGPVWLIVGAVAGVVVVTAAMVAIMRARMVVPERSSKSFEATCEAIETAVPAAEGWSFPLQSFDMGSKLAEKGALPANVKRIRLYFVCNPRIAKKVLGARPHLSAIMPCSWSVFELDDGSVWLAHMNISMMSKMMGGEVGNAMSEVAAADGRFMEEVLR